MLDSAIALNLAWLVNSAIVIMAAAAFFTRDLEIDSIEAAHQTLVPLLGGAAGAAFAVALLAAGLSSSVTATLAGQIIIEGFLNVKFGLIARRLITIVPAVLVIAAGLDAYWVLILSQVSLSIQLPFAIAPLIWLTARPRVMGEFVNARVTTLIAAAVAGLIVILNILLLAQVAGLR